MIHNRNITYPFFTPENRQINITVSPQFFAEQLFDGTHTLPETILISITEPEEDANLIITDNIHLFRLHFYDLEASFDDMGTPTPEDFIGLKNFIDTYQNTVKYLFVH